MRWAVLVALLMLAALSTAQVCPSPERTKKAIESYTSLNCGGWTSLLQVVHSSIATSAKLQGLTPEQKQDTKNFALRAVQAIFIAKLKLLARQFKKTKPSGSSQCKSAIATLETLMDKVRCTDDVQDMGYKLLGALKGADLANKAVTPKLNQLVDSELLASIEAAKNRRPTVRGYGRSKKVSLLEAVAEVEVEVEVADFPENKDDARKWMRILGSTCDETTMKNLLKIPNGCSIPGGWAPFVNTFTDACYKHDICYCCSSSHRLDREFCDTKFWQNNNQLCLRRYTRKYLDAVQRGACLKAASAYYKAVAEFGDDHYKRAPCPNKPGCSSACAKTMLNYSFPPA